ncbi:MAG: FAD-dependent oxidoreductase [Planctomycetota bacterium]
MMISKSKETVLVVGGGVVGLACAHYLERQGFAVTVIDKGSVAGACSHGNCGYISPSHVPPLTEPGAIKIALKSLFNPKSPFRVKPTLSPALWNWMWQFARRCNHRQVREAGKHLQAILDASLVEYKQLMAAEKFDCEWKEVGLLYVYRTEEALNEFAETDRMLTEHFGVSADRIEGDALVEFDPGLREGLAGAYHYPGDTSVRPDLLNRQWRDRLLERGVELLESCELHAVEKDNTRITRLSTSKGEFTADHYVFAMGAWSAKWSEELRCSIPVQPGKGYSVTMKRPEPCVKHPMLFPEHKVGVSPFDGGFRLGSMMEFVGYDESIPDYRINQLRESAKHFLVAPVDGQAEEKWFGWRPMTWDSLPIIGRAPKLSNATLATGHNMLGLSLAAATGRLVAEMLTGSDTHIDVEAFSPSRFGR